MAQSSKNHEEYPVNSRSGSDVESDLYYIAVFDDVTLAFDPELLQRGTKGRLHRHFFQTDSPVIRMGVLEHPQMPTSSAF